MLTDKTNILLKQPQKLFHTADLKVLWNIANKNTLYKSIGRLIKRGVLIAVQKGLYSVLPIDQLDPIELGFRIFNQQCYLTTETVLFQNGLINQPTTKITYVSSISKNISMAGQNFLARQLKPIFLNNMTGVVQNNNGVLVAILNRAIADMLYFQPNYHFDATNLINWDQVKKIQHEVGYL